MFHCFQSRVSVDTTTEEVKQLVKSLPFCNAYEDYHADSVQLLSASEAERYLEQPYVHAMSPEKYWITAFEPLGALACNAKVLIHNIGSRVFMSFDRISGQPTALSFGVGQAVKFGVRYRMDFYVHPDFLKRSAGLFMAHVLRQLVYVPETAAAKSAAASGISFSALHGKQVDSSLVRRVVFKDFGLKPTEIATTDTDGYLVEAPDAVLGNSAKL